MNPIRYIYVHIPFCARICPYCAFYKDLLDRSQTSRFCEAILRDLDQQCASFTLTPETIYFGGGTPTALTTSQLEFLLGGFHERLDLSSLVEWTIEANPGSVSARKAALLRKLGVTRVSLGIQSWDDELLKLLGREHNSEQAEQSFRLLRAAGFSNMPATNITKSPTTRVPALRQLTIAPIGWAKITSVSARARFRLLTCIAGKTSAIIAVTPIGFFPVSRPRDSPRT